MYCSFIVLLTVSSAYAQSGWFQQNSGTSDTLYGVHFTSYNTGYTCGKGGIMLKTTNGGINWFPLNTTVTATLYRVYFVNQNTGIAIGQGGIIIRTTNSGTLWGILVNTGIHGFLKGIYFIDQNTGFITGWKGYFLKSTDAGANWDVSVLDSAKDFESVYFVNNLTGFVAGLAGICFKTTDGGLSWTYLTLDVSKNFYSIRFINDMTGFVVGGWINATIIMTTNTGTNWSPMLGGATGVRLYDLYFVNQDTGYICGRDGYIMKSVNGGINWVTQNTPTTNYLWSIFFASTDTGYTVGCNGTILKTVSGGEPIGLRKISNIVPDKFILYQNYPNPFNPVTRIKFQIPSSHISPERGMQNISLIVFDILGREVVTLFSSPWRTIGGAAYEVEFYGTNYPSGVYYYRLSASEFTETKALVLVK
jgi:photosystem II stability/assembly factor-like uncharacterized protein